MDAAAADHLFAQTLLDHEEDGPGWAAVDQLRLTGDRYIFDLAVRWTESTESLKRKRAAEVLCQLRDAPSRVPLFQKESCAVLLRMLPGETDEHVLDAVICGFGHLGNPNAIPAIVSFSGHASAEVRFAVAFALGSFAEDQQSISTLLQLVTDNDADVRDWAVFSLGVQGNADSTEIREALMLCLTDVSENVQEEAAVGLAKRKDQRVLPALLSMLDQELIGVRVFEAAALLLDLPSEPPNWRSSECKSALIEKFGTPPLF